MRPPKNAIQPGIRKRSATTLAGMPLVDIALGADPSTGEESGRARGIVAIGDSAEGVLALGGEARGLIDGRANRMSHLKGTTLLLLLLLPVAAEAADVKDLIRQGTVLHDQGHYTEAIALYRDALRQDPGNEEAMYELAFSLSASGDLAGCSGSAEAALKAAKKLRAPLYALQAACLDDAGEAAKAVEVYTRGSAEFPTDPGLAFNFAVTQLRLGRAAEAKDLAKTAIAGRPNHASAHFLLAKAYAVAGYDIPALITALRFLAMEPVGDRAKEMATLARSLLAVGVKRDSETHVSVTVDAHAPVDEGDFSTEAMMLPLLAALRYTVEWEKRPESEQLAEEIRQLLGLLAEDRSKPEPTSFVKARFVPFLAAIDQAGLAVPFAYSALQTLDLAGGKEWVAAHQAEMDKLAALLERLNGAATP